MASTEEPKTGNERGPDTPHEEIVSDGTPQRPRPLFPLIGIIIALLIGLLVFTATRSGPNYQEEQFTPDQVEDAG